LLVYGKAGFDELVGDLVTGVSIIFVFTKLFWIKDVHNYKRIIYFGENL
jgi:hypothetical protein